MDRIAVDDCIYALKQTFDYYGKSLETTQVAFWKDWFSKQSDASKIKAALVTHVGKSKFAPKIADLTEIMANESHDRSAAYQPLPTPKAGQCPTEISDAWLYWLPEFHGAAIGGVMGRVGGVSADKAEEMLMIVNQEAKRVGEPHAIPDEYKLVSVWG